MKTDVGEARDKLRFCNKDCYDEWKYETYVLQRHPSWAVVFSGLGFCGFCFSYIPTNREKKNGEG